MKTKFWLAAIFLGVTAQATADIHIGVSVSATGPAASLGIPEKNTIDLLPTEIAGEKVQYIILDDATDPSVATKNARKLLSEYQVDVSCKIQGFDHQIRICGTFGQPDSSI
jgi:branched-chain amino acid transport system substrate-binding protein